VPSNSYSGLGSPVVDMKWIVGLQRMAVVRQGDGLACECRDEDDLEKDG
jgi:pantothenate synthetase